MGAPCLGAAHVLGRIIIRPYLAFVIAAICTHRMDRGQDLIEQGVDLRSVINACRSQGLCDKLASGLIDADVQFAPSKSRVDAPSIPLRHTLSGR